MKSWFHSCFIGMHPSISKTSGQPSYLLVSALFLMCWRCMRWFIRYFNYYSKDWTGHGPLLVGAAAWKKDTRQIYLLKGALCFDPFASNKHPVISETQYADAWAAQICYQISGLFIQPVHNQKNKCNKYINRDRTVKV